ncbi:unnamed protein product [Tilletia controversa]|uniref:polynucleotide adenylyltransferase n=3 Tax=Tilletia TaxID=13289 RepID=A0A8X7MNR3_9BASI|nr:hypothetical protein CF336_g6026 [Tilletia laevis]KAE8191813.1 hypothetical protein CF328_g5565 [Tilletia controversa]KAE8262768.1 hypothetical protein A4X03_0g2194 [Tilletia caries]KAE8194636.1 hypothetical protein CF335_g5297 [Tilletia laevis]KAE8243227.1 hypothetical protein A4X06_0g6463 [Tilletia controversa]
MTTAFDGEDFISFDAEPGGTRVGGAQAEGSGTTRNRIAGLMAAATAQRGAGKSSQQSAPAQSNPQASTSSSAAAAAATVASAFSSSATLPSGPRLSGTKRKHNEIAADENRLSKKERQELFAASTPWSMDVDWDQCRNGAEMLHREIMAFDQWLMPTTAELECRDMVIALIRKAIQSKWPDADVRPFGSHNTQLYLPEGDIDLVVLSSAMNTQSREMVLRNMAYILRTNNLTQGNVQIIAKAKVPIIKFICAYGDYKIDISVNQANGLTAADYILDNLVQQPALRPLIMVIKQLLSARNLSEVYLGGLGSYSVILTAISFMQMHPRIQRCEIDPARNLGVLLLEYLELYGKRFGYDELGISIRGKGSYFNKAMRGWTDHRGSLKLCLEDPLDPTNDVAAGSFNFYEVKSALAGGFDLISSAIGERSMQLGGPSGTRQSAEQIRNAAKKKKGNSRYSDDEDEWARQMLMAEMDNAGAKDPMSLLGKLFGIKPSTIKHRKKIKKLWDSNELQHKLGRPTARITPEPGPSTVKRIADSRTSSRTDPKAAKSSRKALASSINRAVVASIRASTNGQQRGASEEDVIPIDDESDGEEEESRYATVGSSRRTGKAAEGQKGLAPGQAVETAFVLDDSASSAGESNGDGEARAYTAAADGIIVSDDEDQDDAPVPRKRARASDSTSPAKRRATRREVDDFWASKGNATGSNDSSDNDVVFMGAAAQQ